MHTQKQRKKDKKDKKEKKEVMIYIPILNEIKLLESTLITL